MSSREIIKWVITLNIKKNVEISGPATIFHGNSLSMRRESLSLRIRISFCSWATKRGNFFLNRVFQTWNSSLESRFLLIKKSRTKSKLLFSISQILYILGSFLRIYLIMPSQTYK